MKKKPNIRISLQTSADISSAEVGRAFIEALCADARLTPDRISITEPVREPYGGIEDFVANWWAMPSQGYSDGKLVSDWVSGPMFKRVASIKNAGKIRHRTFSFDNRLSPGHIWWDCNWDSSINVEDLFDVWSTLLNPDVAMLHIYTSTEREVVDFSREDDRFSLGVFGGPMMPQIPNIGWAMAFGPGDMNYLQDVDVPRIRAAGFAVDERDGFVVVRVTDKLSDVVDDFAHFSRRRAELKALFRPDLFSIKLEPDQRRATGTGNDGLHSPR
jgi:hypothetical protein